MKIQLDQFRAAFFEEASDHLAAIEAGLLVLEGAPRDAETLNAVFRAAHSIKGASGTFGLADVAHFTHALESLLDLMREGRIEFSRETGDVLLQANDVLRGLLAAAQSGAQPPSDVEATRARLAAIAGGDRARDCSAPEAKPSVAPVRADYRVRFVPGADVLRQGMDPLLLLRELTALGDIVELVPEVDRVPLLAALDPESCHFGWSLVVRTECSREEILDVFAFVEDASDIAVARIEDEPRVASAGAAAGTAATATSRGSGPGRMPAVETASIRVATDKVDRLVNLVGELVITQSMIADAVKNFRPDDLPRLREAVTEMERTTRELQERVMAVRMVPIASVLNRFPRLVRDLAASCGKDVELEVVGEETELDKGVVEQIGDPLTHLVRNAVDHGVEPAEERIRAGKPARGRVTIAASCQGGSVVIEVADDGRGLDAERIREKAIQAGLVDADAKLSAEQAYALVFAAGLSTASVVSDVSGRGVGMDVVKRNVESLGGAVGISSTPGQGTCFRIKLPLTLAILDGLTLRVGEGIFIVPLVSVVESIQLEADQVKRVLGEGEVVVVRGQPVPLIRLNRALGFATETTAPIRSLVVIVEHGDGVVALLVDEILGQQQVVIKSLERTFRRTEGISAATILGDGRVALILDVPGLVTSGRGGSAALAA